MSRAYSFHIEVKGFAEEKSEEIERALKKETGLDGEPLRCFEDTSVIVFAEDGNLCGGETEEEFVDRVTKSAWKANGKFCTVSVCLTPLDDCNSYALDESDYDRLMGKE